MRPTSGTNPGAYLSSPGCAFLNIYRPVKQSLSVTLASRPENPFGLDLVRDFVSGSVNWLGTLPSLLLGSFDPLIGYQDLVDRRFSDVQLKETHKTNETLVNVLRKFDGNVDDRVLVRPLGPSTGGAHEGHRWFAFAES